MALKLQGQVQKTYAYNGMEGEIVTAMASFNDWKYGVLQCILPGVSFKGAWSSSWDGENCFLKAVSSLS